MSSNSMNYCEYFDVDEHYFPCIDESAINNGAEWDTTYPHDTFIELLKKFENMIGGQTHRSLWIHGAYGTGKSQCAYTLKKLVDVSESEVRTYWDKFEPLRKEKNLLEKFIGHKKRGIIAAYRYASGGISSIKQLFLAIQESIKKALIENNVKYTGENTLKDGVISWLEAEDYRKELIDKILQKPKWKASFSESSANEIINSLRKNSDVTSLMNNIFNMAAEESITALDFTSDILRDWIIDVITKNDIKIVFIWDEFSDYFRQNSTSLGEFQKIVSICQEQPFYLIIVTHPLTSIAKGYDSSNRDSPWSVVQQRFDKVEITLPPNIAFDLIGHAFPPKSAAKPMWESMVGDLYSNINNSCNAVVKAVNIRDPKIIRNILPIHPFAALVLKNIASSFQSNQRSMFDFIKTPKELDVHAFQWFIQNNGPTSDRPLLTVDMLWDFFYEKGKDYLSQDIRLILDTFNQQTSLFDREKIVLKTILIMQAIDQRLGGVLSILKPTDQNLTYAFEGDEPELESECKSIAKRLLSKGILIENPIGDGKKCYSAAILAGDGSKIETLKKKIREDTDTLKLFDRAVNIGAALNLSPALKLRYAQDISYGRLPVVCITNFIKVLNALKDKDNDWHFYAVLALAKTEEEAMSFRTIIKNTISNPDYKNIVVIDALSSPLGAEAFETYVEHSAMASYYSRSNVQQSRDNERKAIDVLEKDWKERVCNGNFLVFSNECIEGEKAATTRNVHDILKTRILQKFPYVVDFSYNFTETQLSLIKHKDVAKAGIETVTPVKGIMNGVEKGVLAKFWDKKEYWKEVSLEDESLVIIKKELESMISSSFSRTGRISISELYDCIECNFGFAPSNLTACIFGFLLKEYSSEPYRAMDSEGHREPMTPEKLSEMIYNYVKNKRITDIVSLTESEKKFYEFTEVAWNIPCNTCTSPAQTANKVMEKMRELSYPVWSLKYSETDEVFDLLNDYIKLVQSSGEDLHDIANTIGEAYVNAPNLAYTLKNSLTTANCQKGMKIFLENFNNGQLITLVNVIGANDSLMTDVKELFDVQYSSLWDVSIGQSEIQNLTTEYEIVQYTNKLLNVSAHSKYEAFKLWKEQLRFICFSCESITSKIPLLADFFNTLNSIYRDDKLVSSNMKTFLDEMKKHFDQIQHIFRNQNELFKDIYSPYLTDFSAEECEEIRAKITESMFNLPATKSNACVKSAAELFKQSQLKSQLSKFWFDQTGTKNPMDWSDRYRTPILCCMNSTVYADAKTAFNVLNGNVRSEKDIENALNFLRKADFFDDLNSQEFRDQSFINCIISDYKGLLTNLETVRNNLEKTGIKTYDWNDDPRIKENIKLLATNEYQSGGSDKVLDIIKNMSPEQLQKWLSEIIVKDMGLGVKIINNSEEK